MTAKTIHRAGLIGWPVAHSVSPAMFNAAFAALSLPWHYDAYPLRPGDLAAGLQALQAAGVCGLNVTVPHKRAVIDLLDTVRPEARLIGAVNTIVAVNDGGVTRWEGTNTDADGLHHDLLDLVGAPRPGAIALILGAGGAARAAAVTLARQGYALTIVARRPERGEELAQDVRLGLRQPAAIQTIPWDTLSRADLTGVRLLVNCTPVGMWPHSDESPWPPDLAIPPAAVVYDMVYRPAETQLMQQARQAGATAFNGLGMLVRQGAAAFTLWTGREAPADIMLQAARQALT